MQLYKIVGLLLALVVLIGAGQAATGAVLRESSAVVEPRNATPRVAPLAGGRIIYAASCEQADVQAAIDAASDGDLVVVPPGHCTWTTLQTHTSSVRIQNKGITLLGSGQGVTVITDETGANWHEEPVLVTDASGFRISGFTFQGMKKRSSTEKAIIMDGDCANWRIDHCTFDVSASEIGSQGSGMTLVGSGVVDHCTFLNTYTSVVFMGDGDASWERPLALGSAGAMYAEDNVMHNTAIVGDGATDAYNGARYVFRYNAVLNARAGHHGFDSGGYRSPHSFEIYGNTFHWTVPNSWYTWRSRGGTGVLFDNVITGAVSGPTFGVVNYRTCCCNWCTNVDPPASGYPCSPYTACAAPLHSNCGQWGRCDGHNPLDGNLDATGYPCKDQAGRTTDMDGDGIQDAAPMYLWNNTVNGAVARLTVSDPWGCDTPSMADHIQEGRDFFNDTRHPDYTPYTYPHPLTQDVLLTAAPLDGAARLNWEVVTAFAFPISTTWEIAYATGNGAPVVAATGLVSTTQAYILTGLTLNTSYTVTLSGMFDVPWGDPLIWASATAVVTPRDQFVYLPLVTKGG